MNLTKHICTFLACFLGILSFNYAQINRIEPPNWWVGMKNPQVQLLVHGDNIKEATVSIKHPGVEILAVHKAESPNYLFIDLDVSKAVGGNFPITFKKGKRTIAAPVYTLLEREAASTEIKGFDNSDVLYLITPDRFVNGDTKNDAVAGLREAPDRTNKGGRHGGDIAGLSNSIDYLKDMGFTAIWLNPLLENDMEEYSYHGYSTTDFYKVDPRFGTNQEYRQLSKVAKSKGIKMIMDMIVNHCGSFHWWMDDLPMENWINQWPEYTGTNHRKTLLQDPYASTLDRRIFTDGWFVPTMPDLNQRNPFMATYLTQNAIWWIEYLGLSGIRMDTYPYPDMDYMTEWTERVMEEYPNFNVVGEEWNEEPAIVAYWQKGKKNPNGYTSELNSLMDFPVQAAAVRALKEEESWSGGLKGLYEVLAQDFLYADPSELVVFPDNHDMTRIFSQLDEDYDLYKMAMSFFLTIRGVPQLYYGTEILMTSTSDHGIVRTDFPGGWQGDMVNAFTGEGLTAQQKESKAFLKKLLNWRKTATSVHTGQLMHFIPNDGVYVYFRYDDQQQVMVILNKNEDTHQLDLDRFVERLDGVVLGKDVISGQQFDMTEEITLPKKSALILELK